MLVRTQVVNLDHDLTGARTIGRQSPADAARTGCAGAGAAAVDGLGDGGVVAAVTVPAAGDAGPPAAAVLGEGGDRAPGAVARGGGRAGYGAAGVGAAGT